MTALLDALRAHDPTDPRSVGKAALDEAGRMTQRSKRLLWIALTIALALITAAAVVTTLVAREQRDRARTTEGLARHAEKLAQERLDDELRLHARLAFDRGDWITSLTNVAKLVARGVDEPMLRMVVGAASWAWPSERLQLRGVRSAIPAGERALVELERELLVVDATGTIVQRLPLGKAFGVDIDAIGEHVIIIDPDVRLIPVENPAKARVLASAASEVHLFPAVLGPERYAALVDSEIRVYDDAGSIVLRIERNGGFATNLVGSQRIAIIRPDHVTVTSLADNTQVTYRGSVTSLTERKTDHVIALSLANRVVLVDRAMRPVQTLEVGGAPQSSRFAPDGRHLVVFIDDHLVIYDLASGQRRSRIAARAGAPSIIDDDGVVTAFDGVVRWWSLDGVLRASLVAPARQIDRVFRMGTQIAVVGGGVFQLYDRPFVAAQRDAAGCDVARIVRTRDASSLVVCGNGRVGMWTDTFTPFAVAPVRSPAWVLADPTLRHVLLMREEEMTIVENGAVRAVPFPLESLIDVTVATGGVYVAVGKGEMRRLDLATLAWKDLGRPATIAPEKFVTAMVAMDTRALVVFERRLLVEVGPDGFGAPRSLPLSVEQLSLSADGNVIAARAADGGITVLDRATLAPRALAAVNVEAAFALDRTGDRLAAVTAANRIAIIDTRTGTTLVELGIGPRAIGDIAFGADGKSLVVNVAGAPTRVPLPYDERPLADLARELACRFGDITPAATRSTSCR
jgi:hypothetical protein